MATEEVDGMKQDLQVLVENGARARLNVRSKAASMQIKAISLLTSSVCVGLGAIIVRLDKIVSRMPAD